jgi:hypothetical protein
MLVAAVIAARSCDDDAAALAQEQKAVSQFALLDKAIASKADSCQLNIVAKFVLDLTLVLVQRSQS